MHFMGESVIPLKRRDCIERPCGDTLPWSQFGSFPPHEKRDHHGLDHELVTSRQITLGFWHFHSTSHERTQTSGGDGVCQVPQPCVQLQLPSPSANNHVLRLCICCPINGLVAYRLDVSPPPISFLRTKSESQFQPLYKRPRQYGNCKREKINPEN